MQCGTAVSVTESATATPPEGAPPERAPPATPVVEPPRKYHRRDAASGAKTTTPRKRKKNHNTPSEFARYLFSSIITEDAKKRGIDLDYNFSAYTRFEANVRFPNLKMNKCLRLCKKLGGVSVCQKVAAEWQIRLPSIEAVKPLFEYQHKVSLYVKDDFALLRHCVPLEQWSVPALPDV